MRPQRSKKTAVIIWVVVTLIAFQVLYTILAFNASGPAQVYRHRYLAYRIVYWLELVAFLPTLWVTKPMGSIAMKHGLLGLMTLLEVSVLSIGYGALAYLFFVRRLSTASIGQFISRNRWRLLAILGLLAVVSLWARLSGGQAYNVGSVGAAATIEVLESSVYYESSLGRAA